MIYYASLLATLALGVVAQDTTTEASDQITPTATILAGTQALTTGIAASVVAADACDTTYQLVCTDTLVCYGESVTFTVTANPTEFHYSSSTELSGLHGVAQQSCSIDNEGSSAVCSLGVSVSSADTSTSIQTTTTATGEDFVFGQYPITAGAEKLPASTASCTATDSGAMPTALALKDVYKVMVVPAAAAAAAGALL